MLDTMRRLHRDAHIGAYHKKSCYTGARAALPTPLQVPSFAQSDIIKALPMLPASRHTRTAMHAATKLPLMHTHTHSARGAATPRISLCPHGADLAGVIYTVLVTLHGTSSSLPVAELLGKSFCSLQPDALRQTNPEPVFLKTQQLWTSFPKLDGEGTVSAFQ